MGRTELDGEHDARSSGKPIRVARRPPFEWLSPASRSRPTSSSSLTRWETVERESPDKAASCGRVMAASAHTMRKRALYSVLRSLYKIG